MQYISKYNLFGLNEDNGSDNKPKRSERMLNQVQREWDDDSNIVKTKKVPSMVFTDIVGSSKMWSEEPLKMYSKLQEHHNLVTGLAEKYNGWVVKTIGDAFMVYFEPHENSIINALKFSKALILSERRYKLRIGVCAGNMEERTYRLQKVDLKDFYGNAVNISSRMESKLAEENGIAFTSLVPLSKKQKYTIGVEIGKMIDVDLGRVDLKGVNVNFAYKINIRS